MSYLAIIIIIVLLVATGNWQLLHINNANLERARKGYNQLPHKYTRHIHRGIHVQLCMFVREYLVGRLS